MSYDFKTKYLSFYKCCNSSGVSVAISYKQNIDHSVSYLRHTIGEWGKYKVKRGNSVYSIGETSFEAFYR